jgi:hypothetical protein
MLKVPCRYRVINFGKKGWQMKIHLGAAILAVTGLLGMTATAQQAKGKSHTLEGKVEGVQTAAGGQGQEEVITTGRTS